MKKCKKSKNERQLSKRDNNSYNKHYVSMKLGKHVSNRQFGKVKIIITERWVAPSNKVGLKVSLAISIEIEPQVRPYFKNIS